MMKLNFNNNEEPIVVDVNNQLEPMLRFGFLNP